MRHLQRAGKPPAGKLGVVVGEFPSTSETFILRELLALEQAGFDLLILALRRPDEEPHADAIRLMDRCVWAAPRASVRSLGRQLLALLRHPAGYLSAVMFVLTNALRQRRALRELVGGLLCAGDLAASGSSRGLAHIHAQFCSRPATVGLLLAEMLGVTFSMSCHARDIFTSEGQLVGEKLAEAEFATVCTRHGLERLQRQYQLAAGGNLHLVYHGVDPSRFMPPLERPTERLVLAVGRMVPKKGFDILLRAAALARSHGAEFQLHFVGDGPEREDLERLASGLGLRDQTVFHGRLTQEELLPLYQRASALVCASIVTEDGDRDGIPNVILEALAMGVPVVATTTGGIPEVIEHEKTGLLAPPGDPAALAEQLERVLYDEELCERVRRAGRERIILEFDISRNIDRLVALLEKYVPRRQPEDGQE